MSALYPDIVQAIKRPDIEEFGDDELDEMPHLELDSDVNGIHFGSVDLRIELYPMPRSDRQALLRDFHQGGVIGQTKNGWIFFGPDETVSKTSPSQMASVTKLPSDWQKYALNISNKDHPKMTEVFKIKE